MDIYGTLSNFSAYATGKNVACYYSFQSSDVDTGAGVVAAKLADAPDRWVFVFGSGVGPTEAQFKAAFPNAVRVFQLG